MMRVAPVSCNDMLGRSHAKRGLSVTGHAVREAAERPPEVRDVREAEEPGGQYDAGRDLQPAARRVAPPADLPPRPRPVILEGIVHAQDPCCGLTPQLSCGVHVGRREEGRRYDAAGQLST